jgi:exonuclease VII large subunit
VTAVKETSPQLRYPQSEGPMSENIAQTIQKALQDLVAPDVRELKILVAGLQKQIDQRFEQVNQRFEQVDQRFETQRQEMNQRFDAQSKQSEAQFQALMAAFGEFKAQSELATMRVIATLSERVAVLEARHQ